LLSQVSDRTTQASQIFLSVIPILLVYPFLQRYFVHGLVVGSVKG
ncbi:carbohydrate ABC transporter permease, partial [Paenibacillus tundrae]|nr:carbohydrate ABC transporter permease [Paenibacillus tundrae]